MSQGGAGQRTEESSTAKKIYRTVTPEYFGRPDTEMTVIGIAYFLGILVLLVPLLPFLAIIWLVSKVLDRARESGSRD